MICILSEFVDLAQRIRVFILFHHWGVAISGSQGV
jgi:hypothetical protein